MPNPANEAEAASAADRRKFLAACGKFAVVTPPAITLLLSTSLNSTAAWFTLLVHLDIRHRVARCQHVQI